MLRAPTGDVQPASRAAEEAPFCLGFRPGDGIVEARDLCSQGIGERRMNFQGEGTLSGRGQHHLMIKDLGL